MNTNTHPRISLIVAVYNAEAYFHTFMQSVLSQTFTDFEVLLVNDGSSDGSGALCDDYAARDSRIRVFHKANGGVASARQVGIENARGEYTIHADPDDTVAPTYLEDLYAEAVKEDADMVMCDYYVVQTKKMRYRRIAPKSLDSSKMLDGILLAKIPGFLCNKLIRRSLYERFGISFVAGLDYGEDTLVCVKLMLGGIKIAYVKKALYYYNWVVNPNSITRKYNRQKFEMRLNFIKQISAVIPEGEHTAGVNYRCAEVAYQCMKWGVIDDKEFESIFRPYRGKFWRSKFSLKRRLVLLLAASGFQSMARNFIKKKR